jgi:acyl-CoA dehydrogenase/citronellyl-CoA dehydrogenase
MATGQLPGAGTFNLDDEHRQFKEVCERFVANEMIPRVAAAETAGFPAELWPKLADAGLLGVGHPERYGGTGGGVLALAILSEAMAMASGGLAITPLVSSYMAAPHLARFGTDEQKEHYLAGVLAGEMVAAIAVTEPGAGSDVAGIATRATPTGDSWAIRGSKVFITNAGLADFVIVAAKTDAEAGHRGISMFLVERGAAGMTLSEPMAKLGWHASDTREIAFDDCLVPAERLLGGEGRGFYQIMEAFQVERISLAGMAVGLAQRALDDTVAHVRERAAFGSTLDRKQVVRHRAAEMSTKVEAARLMTYRAGALFDTGDPGAADAVAMAKLFAPRLAAEVVDEAVQLFGGYGFIEETPIAMHYRDARILRIGGGTDEVQLEILAKRLFDRA